MCCESALRKLTAASSGVLCDTGAGAANDRERSDVATEEVARAGIELDEDARDPFGRRMEAVFMILSVEKRGVWHRGEREREREKERERKRERENSQTYKQITHTYINTDRHE